MSTILFFLDKIVVNIYYRFLNFYHKKQLKYFKVKHGKIKFIGRAIINIHKTASVSIGDNFNCLSGNRACVSSSNPTKIVVWKDAKLIIGENCGFSATAIACKSEIIIGNNVKIGSGSILHDSDHHSLNPESRKNTILDRKNTNHSKLKIENNVFIGANCTILKGVTVGDSAVIGANSVVTKDIGPSEIWAGNPARFIKKLNKIDK
tara:strand:- start:6156 stop:6773 length:618 start_codon:yes stop_codon:yes gene_type:complete